MRMASLDEQRHALIIRIPKAPLSGRCGSKEGKLQVDLEAPVFDERRRHSSLIPLPEVGHRLLDLLHVLLHGSWLAAESGVVGPLVNQNLNGVGGPSGASSRRFPRSRALGERLDDLDLRVVDASPFPQNT